MLSFSSSLLAAVGTLQCVCLQSTTQHEQHVFVCVWMCVCVCVYVCTHKHKHTYIYIYMYTYKHIVRRYSTEWKWKLCVQCYSSRRECVP